MRFREPGEQARVGPIGMRQLERLDIIFIDPI
jgi:hypothetical protein